VIGVVGEFGTPEELFAAIRRLRELVDDPWRIEAYSPFELPEVDRILGLRRSIVPTFVLFGGIAGATTSWVLQWLITAIDYPLNVGNRPVNPLPAYIPLIFELGVLGAGIAAFLALLGLCGLPMPWHPLFEVDGFERASRDRYFVLVNTVGTLSAPFEQALRDAGAISVHLVRP